LDDLHELPLIKLLLEYLPLDISIAVTLHPSDQLEYNFITSLLKTSKSTSPEENFGVTQTVSLSGELNLVKKSICSSLVISSIGNFSSTKDLVPRLEVRVQHPVRETSHTNPDTFQYTITSKLVHNKFRFNTSRLLVGVGHNATDEVRLSAVKSSHQSSKLNQVDRGDSLAAATLLLLLLFFLWGSRLARMFTPQEDQQVVGRFLQSALDVFLAPSTKYTLCGQEKKFNGEQSERSLGNHCGTQSLFSPSF